MIDETGDPDRVIDHGYCSSIVEYSRLLWTMLEYDRFCVYYELNIHSIWIMSIYTRVIPRIEDVYTLVHLGITVICG